MTSESSPKHDAARHLVLIVEDDKLMRIFYQRLFRDCEHDLAYHLEESAEGALDYLRDNRVDAIISDWDLPGISGINLVKALRSHPATSAVPILMVSGRTGPDYRDIALRHGANDYFAKPFDIVEFMGRLRALLTRKDAK